MTAPQPLRAVAPSIGRRLACMAYESLLLFGVVMAAGYLYATVTQQRHALQGSSGLQLFLFAVLGLYFAGFWSHSGQTLAMKTWRIRLQTPDSRPPSRARAFARYAASWLWFMPALVSAHLWSLRSVPMFSAVVGTGMVAYAALACTRADRQFLHDALCGTQLIDTRPNQAAP
jgi:uncharacterized RDD family membrane protein YckC